MNSDDRLLEALRAAVRPMPGQDPEIDLWPRVLERTRTPSNWSWVDVGLALLAFSALAVRPDLLLPLAFFF